MLQVRDTEDGPVVVGKDRAEFLAGLAVRHLERVWALSKLGSKENALNLWLLERWGGHAMRECARAFAITDHDLIARAFEERCGKEVETLLGPVARKRRVSIIQERQRGDVEARVMRAMAAANAAANATNANSTPPSPNVVAPPPIVSCEPALLSMQTAYPEGEENKSGTTKSLWPGAAAKALRPRFCRDGKHLATARIGVAATYRQRGPRGV